MACLVNDFSSFDTPEDPGGASIVERKDFQAKRPLWLWLNGCNVSEGLWLNGCRVLILHIFRISKLVNMTRLTELVVFI